MFGLHAAEGTPHARICGEYTLHYAGVAEYKRLGEVLWIVQQMVEGSRLFEVKLEQGFQHFSSSQRKRSCCDDGVAGWCQSVPTAEWPFLFLDLSSPSGATLRGKLTWKIMVTWSEPPLAWYSENGSPRGHAILFHDGFKKYQHPTSQVTT